MWSMLNSVMRILFYASQRNQVHIIGISETNDWAAEELAGCKEYRSDSECHFIDYVWVLIKFSW